MALGQWQWCLEAPQAFMSLLSSVLACTPCSSLPSRAPVPVSTLLSPPTPQPTQFTPNCKLQMKGLLGYSGDTAKGGTRLVTFFPEVESGAGGLGEDSARAGGCVSMGWGRFGQDIVDTAQKG